jgi:hypothetical protein
LTDEIRVKGGVYGGHLEDAWRGRGLRSLYISNRNQRGNKQAMKLRLEYSETPLSVVPEEEQKPESRRTIMRSWSGHEISVGARRGKWCGGPAEKRNAQQEKPLTLEGRND